MTIIGSGIDIIEVERVRDIVNKWGRRFLERVFTKRELLYCSDKGELFRFQSLAARFAAKEAVIKALGIKDIAFKNIEIINNGDGKPECIIKSGHQRTGAPVTRILLSISHTKDHAVANALLIEDGYKEEKPQR